jgi:hypothetical protein
VFGHWCEFPCELLRTNDVLFAAFGREARVILDLFGFIYPPCHGASGGICHASDGGCPRLGPAANHAREVLRKMTEEEAIALQAAVDEILALAVEK